jgi:hypothetical protein
MEEASQDLIFECPSLGLTAGSLHRWWKVGAALLGRKEGLNVDIKFVTTTFQTHQCESSGVSAQ